MINASNIRKKQWFENNAHDEDLMKSLNIGAIDPWLHPKYHKFRDRTKNLETDRKDFFIRNYQPAKLRAAKSEADLKRLYMEREPFNEEIKRNALIRERAYYKDTCHTMRFGLRTENERVSSEINKLKGLDFSHTNNKMLNFPEWKTNNKNRWKSSKGFNNKLGNIRIENSAWEEVPFREHHHDFNPYIGGNKEVSDKICFKERIPENEIDVDNQFLAFNRPDIWGSCLHTSQSMRTKINDNV